MKELYAIDKSTLDAIGNAIREKKGTTEPIPVTSLASEIESIESGSVGILLQAGTYKLVDYRYEGSYPGSFAWERQDLRGMFIEDYYGETYERPFTYVENDGEFCVNFVDEVDIVSSEITPSFNPYDSTIKVILDEAQFISEAFSTWFNACFEKVEDEGGGGGSTEAPKEYTLRSGIWTSKGDTTGNCSSLPYPSYSVSADISGTINDLEFTRITISGYGLGMDDSNSYEGAPYPDIYFYNGDEQVAYYYGGDLDPYSGNFGGFVIHNDTQVTATFCLAFRGLFQ